MLITLYMPAGADGRLKTKGLIIKKQKPIELNTLIADILRQLFENGADKIRSLKKSIKEISSNLLESFRTRVITFEDIREIEKRTRIMIS